MNNTSDILVWNTGRSYTAFGQRIGAIHLMGGVFMSDQDRGINYFLPGANLQKDEIMSRYDYNDRTEYGMLPGINRWELVEKLNAASKDAKAGELSRRVKQA